MPAPDAHHFVDAGLQLADVGAQDHLAFDQVSQRDTLAADRNAALDAASMGDAHLDEDGPALTDANQVLSDRDLGDRDLGDRDLEDRGQGLDSAMPDSAVLDHASADGPATDSSSGADASQGRDAAVGWPFDASLPTPCADPAMSEDGTDWGGWGNYQWSVQTVAAPETVINPLIGQVYVPGQTEGGGPIAGLSAELLFGPWGSLPSTGGRCWNHLAAQYNDACDQAENNCGHNDEYMAAWTTPRKPGLYGLLYRYKLNDGRWLYGDKDGSDNGLQADQAELFQVSGSKEQRLVVATLNLRCRLDDWAARRPLVVESLASVDPDLVAFQEDCSDATGRSQSQEIADLLVAYTRRGYRIQRQQTHLSQTAQGEFGEGISLLSAHPWQRVRVLDLPPTPPVLPAHFPRKAIAADFVIAGQALRFYVTHLEYGHDNANTRLKQINAIRADFPSQGLILVGGDFNDVPDSQAVTAMRQDLRDLWAQGGSGPGLSFPADNPTRRIDYIFVRPSGDSLGALQGLLALDRHQDLIWLSDHRGLAASLTWPVGN